MKRILIITSMILLFCFAAYDAIAQHITQQFNFRETMFILSSEKTKDGTFKFSIHPLGKENEKKDFNLSQLRFDPFIRIMDYHMRQFQTEQLDENSLKELNQEISELFFKIGIEALLENQTAAPVIGSLIISDTINSMCGSNPEKIKVETVEFEILDGFIETIKVIGKSTDAAAQFNYLFENQYGIGFSTRQNFKKLHRIKLYDALNNDDNRYIRLGDLFIYDYKLRSKTKDYSPKNGVYHSFGGQTLEMKKEETSKLFEFIVFSDFSGVEEDNPNGLVQIELSKKIPLNTNRVQNWKRISWIAKGFGFAEYVQPDFRLSKIEQNKRYLQPYMTMDSESNKFNSSTSPIDVLNYQRLSLGLDLNIFFLDNPSARFHSQIDFGFRFGQTMIRDSIYSLNNDSTPVNTGFANDFGVNYFTLSPIMRLQFFPEERFSLSLSTRYHYFVSAFDSPDLLTINKNKSPDEDFSKWVGSHEILGYFIPSELNGKIFVRWIFNHQICNLSKNFHQFQTGISFFITSLNK